MGRLADLAVLSRDYTTLPVEEIGRIESLLTMWAAASSTLPSFEDRRPAR